MSNLANILEKIVNLKQGKPLSKKFQTYSILPLQDRLRVPETMKEVFSELTRLTDAFCKEYLNDEYAVVCRTLTAALCRKRPSPLTSGTPRTWVAGIVYTAGWVNFLFDKEQSPHMSTKELAEKSGVGISTIQGKKKQIQKNLNLIPLEPNYTLSSQLEENPLVWMVELNGIIMDIHNCPPDIQKEALEKGLIPYIPSGKRKIRQTNQNMTFKIPAPTKKKTPSKKPIKIVDEGPTLFDNLEDS